MIFFKNIIYEEGEIIMYGNVSKTSYCSDSHVSYVIWKVSMSRIQQA